MSTIKNKKWQVISLVLIGLFLFTAGASAQCGMWRMNRHGYGPVIQEKYPLTATQQQKIDEIHTKYDEKILPLERELYSKRLELQAYASSPDATAENIKTLRKEIRNLEGKIEDLKVDARAEAAKVLTREQREYYGNTISFWTMGSGWHDDCPMMRSTSIWYNRGYSGMGWMRGRNMWQGWRW